MCTQLLLHARPLQRLWLAVRVQKVDSPARYQRKQTMHTPIQNPPVMKKGSCRIESPAFRALLVNDLGQSAGWRGPGGVRIWLGWAQVVRPAQCECSAVHRRARTTRRYRTASARREQRRQVKRANCCTSDAPQFIDTMGRSASHAQVGAQQQQDVAGVIYAERCAGSG